jgi:hypothetical protein
MVLVSCCKDNTTPAQNQIFRCGRRFRAGGHPRSAVRRCAGRMPAEGLCPCIAPLGGCMLARAGWAGCMAGHMAGAGLGESRVACVVCRGRCRKEEFRKSSGELPGIKKAADRASSVCRRQEFYLKVGVVTKKLLGCATPALGNWFPASPAPSRRTAPDIAEREAKLIRLRGSA